jgi:YggT family protein
MFDVVAANFISAIATVIHYVLTFYMWLVVARAVLSWVNPDPYNPIVRFIYNVTEPVLGWVRRKLPINFGPMDVSPIIVFLAIIFLQQFLVASLRELARSLM